MSIITEWFLALAGAWCMLLLGRVLETRRESVASRPVWLPRAAVRFGTVRLAGDGRRIIPREKNTLPGTLIGENL